MGETPQQQPINADEVIDGVGKGVRRVDATQLSGQVWVIKKRTLRGIIESLVERYADASREDLVAQRDRKNLELEEAQALNADLQALLTKGQQAVQTMADRSEELRREIARLKAGEGDEMVAGHREKIDAQQQYLTKVRQQADQIQQREQGYDQEIADLEREIAALDEQLRTHKALRRLNELLSLKERLQKEIDLLMMSLDLSLAEDASVGDTFQRDLDSLQKGVAQVGQIIGQDQEKMFRAVKLRDRILELSEWVKEQTETLDAQTQKMNEGQGRLAKVYELSARYEQLQSVQGRLRALAGSLMATVG
jgi:DNA repair exonuclease SbcCD ATPase subunit